MVVDDSVTEFFESSNFLKSNGESPFHVDRSTGTLCFGYVDYIAANWPRAIQTLPIFGWGARLGGTGDARSEAGGGGRKGAVAARDSSELGRPISAVPGIALALQ